MKKIVLTLMLGALAISCSKEAAIEKDVTSLNKESGMRFFDGIECNNDTGDCHPEDIILEGFVLDDLEDLVANGTTSSIRGFFNDHHLVLGLSSTASATINNATALRVVQHKNSYADYYEVLTNNTRLYVLPVLHQ